MIFRQTLRLAADNARLRREKRDLFARLVAKTVECERLHVSASQMQRDCDLLALLARDRKVALEFIRTAHDIDNVKEAS